MVSSPEEKFQTNTSAQSPRYIVIGDIHGCYLETRELLEEKIRLIPSDVLVILGDVIDKGPEPEMCVSYLRNLPCKVVLVEGNHEERFLRWMSYEDRRISTGQKNPMEYVPPEFENQRRNLHNEDIKFLMSALPAYQFESGITKFICVHGGIPVLAKTLPDKNWSKKKRNSWLRLRYVRPIITKAFGSRYPFVTLGEEREGDLFWADLYDGRFGHCFFGHQTFKDAPRAFAYATGMDGGCVHGNSLNAAVIERGTITYFNTKARKVYAEEYNPNHGHPKSNTK